MIVHVADSIWLNGSGVCSLEHLSEVSGLSIEEIDDLIESGVITPMDVHAQPRLFQMRTVITVKTARRLRDDFQLDRHGMALALTLLKRIDELEAQLQAFQTKFERSTRKTMDQGL